MQSVTTIKIGPSGNSQSFYENDKNFQSVKTPGLLCKMGLSAYEYSFGRGISIGENKAQEIGRECVKHGITLSAHAPYYINFANDENVENSINYLLHSAKICKLMSGNRIVFHAGSSGKMERGQALEKIWTNLSKAAQIIAGSEYAGMEFCPETMGKMSQIGDSSEIARLCKISEIFVPAMDFGHLNARYYGELNSKEKFIEQFNIVINELGRTRVQNLHIHYSKVEFSKGGEVRHLDNTDDKFGPDYKPMIEAIVDLKLTPTIICESQARQAEDALEIYNYYTQLIQEDLK